MSEGDPAEVPKISDKEQLQVAKEDNLDGIQVDLAESCLPRGNTLLINNFEDASPFDGGSRTSSLAGEPGTPPTPPPLARPFATAVLIRKSLQQAEQLKEDHSQTDELIDQVLAQATHLNHEWIHRNEMARKKRLARKVVHEILGYPGGGHDLI